VDKLIITVATAWEGYEDASELHIPKSAQEIADSLAEARAAGASITHVHPPVSADPAVPARINMDGWLEVRRLVSEASDIIYEHGAGGQPYLMFHHGSHPKPPDELLATFDIRRERPEAISVILNQIDFVWGPDRQNYTMPTRAELERYLTMCLDAGVKPSFEVWHEGSYYNLQWMIERGLVAAPYWLTLFFGANGSMSAPATLDNLLHRLKGLPEGAMWEVAVFCGRKGTTTSRQYELLSHAIALGGHVRVGFEDSPYIEDGVPARSNAQMVEKIVRIARSMGREIATPDETRAALRIPPPS
jgi:3-keto-5-aminohexanoate cleavage enzyme